MLEGRLRISTVTRADGVKEKRAEFTLARLHPLGASPSSSASSVSGPASPAAAAARSVPRPVPARPGGAVAPPPAPPVPSAEPPAWNTSPLVPDLSDDDDIPF
jgi:hypothetical protein